MLSWASTILASPGGAVKNHMNQTPIEVAYHVMGSITSIGNTPFMDDVMRTGIYATIFAGLLPFYLSPGTSLAEREASAKLEQSFERPLFTRPTKETNSTQQYSDKNQRYLNGRISSPKTPLPAAPPRTQKDTFAIPEDYTPPRKTGHNPSPQIADYLTGIFEEAKQRTSK